jgi:hypothetical protein
MDFARIARPNVVLRTCIISGSFPLDDNNSLCLPSTPNPPRSLVFMCFYTPTRVSIRHVLSLLSDVLFSGASLVKVHSSFVLPLPLVCQSLCPFLCSIPGRQSSCYLIINYDSGRPRYRFVSPPAARHKKRRLCTAKEMTGVALVGRRWADRLP